MADARFLNGIGESDTAASREKREIGLADILRFAGPSWGVLLQIDILDIEYTYKYYK